MSTSLEDSVRLAVIDSNVNDIKECVEDVRDRIIRRIRGEEKTSVQYTILIAKMAERERQEDMKGLAKSLDTINYTGDCIFQRNWVTVSNHLSEKGEIMLALVSHPEMSRMRYIVITDHNVYHIGSVEDRDFESVRDRLCPLYTFECPLTLDSAQILTYKGLYAVAVEKKLEAVIRTIPGAYKNGAWRQCDGFFGPYLNHEKKMMSPCPPVLE